MSVWHRIKVRLGLEDEWDDEYYEDDEYYDADEDDADDSPGSRRSTFDSAFANEPTSVRRLAREPDIERARSAAPLRSVPAGSASVSPMSPQVKMHIVEPTSFSEIQGIADTFKQGTPVIMNMTATKPDLAKRLIDFASGLTYGLDGGLQKVSEKVFMLTPHNVDVSAGDMRRLRDKGLFHMEP